MAGTKRRWFKSILQGNSGSSSARFEGQASGASSPATNTASGSVASLPSRSSKNGSNSLTPTDAHSIHTAVVSGASVVISEPLRQGQKQATTPGNTRINTQDSQVSTSSVRAGVRDEGTLYGGPTLLAPLTAAQELDSAFEALAGPAKRMDRVGLTEGLHPPGEKEPSTHDSGHNTAVLKAQRLAPDQLYPPTKTANVQSFAPELTVEPDTPAPNLTLPASPEPEPDRDILASIHVTIEEIKSAQEVLQKKKWYYTDRNGNQVDVGERMRRILRSVEDCAKIVDIAIQHNPEITSLVWAGARFILMVALNGVQFMDNLEAAMVTIVEKMATCEFYAQIYDESLRVSLATSTTTAAFEEGLDAALKDLYAAVRAFLDKAKEYFDPENSVTKKIMNHLKPFSVTMQPLIQDILDKEKIVEKYAGMATMERIKGDSGRLQQVRDVITQIREEMKPLAKLDEILNVAKDVRETLVEFQTQVVQALQPQQREMLTSKSLDTELQELKTKYLAESQQTDIFHANLYVPAQGMATQHAPEEEHFDLWERLEKFMLPESPQRVCLIQGAAGAGKSTFNHYLATRLWEAYDQHISCNEDVTRPIPVFIPLASLYDATRHNQDLVAELFKRRKWPEDRILRAGEQLEFVFILDGYDEIEKRDRNFYIDSRLEDWNAKTVITSRPEYLGPRYQHKFYPPGQPQLLQEYWLAPFSTKDITEYISKYVQVQTSHNLGSPGASSRSVKDYEQLVERPELRAMISNPFLLKMVMTVQPSTGPSTGEIEFKRVTLYRKFLYHWLQSAHERLSRVQLPSALAGPFDILCEESFTAHAEAYCLDFAVELYRHKLLEASHFPDAGHGRSTLKRRENAIWGKFLSNEDPTKRLLRYSSPLIRVGQSYRFLHKSLRDFAVALSIWQDEDLCAPSALLNEFPIVDDHGVIDFIVEEAAQNQELQDHLLACVGHSKQNPGVANAAANAITILVRARIRFHKSDLRGICVAGADISTGWFEGAQLQGADLRRVRLDRIWLRGADLTGACIDGGVFGEKPNFKLEGTGNTPLTCFYTPAGELLVASSNRDYDVKGYDVKVWSVTNRKLLHTFRGHTQRITCVAFPPTGDDLLASASADQTVRLWSRQNEEVPLVHTFKGHEGGVRSVTFSPDAKFLASGGDDGVVCLWSVATHNLIHSISCSQGQWFAFFPVAFSPDGRTLALACQSTLVSLWSPESAQLLHNLQGHTEMVVSVVFAPNGQLLASGSYDNSLNLWSVFDGQLIHSFTGHTFTILIVAFAPDSQMIATASGDNSVRIWSVPSRKVIHIFEGIALSELQSGHSNYLAFSPDSGILATATADGIIRQRLIPRAVSEIVRVGSSHAASVIDLAFSCDKKLLASASEDGTVRLWTLEAPHSANLVNVLARGIAVTFSPDSAFLVTGTGNGNVSLYQSFLDPTSSQESVLGTHATLVMTVAVTPAGNIVASGDNERHICLWSIQSDAKIHTLWGHTNTVRSVDFSPDGQLLVSGSDDTTVRLWSVPCHEMLHIYKGHKDWVRDVAFSPDGKTIASASDDRTVGLWSVPDRQNLHIFEGHTDYVSRVAFSPDGFLLASGSKDRTMRFWSLSSWGLVMNMDVHTEVTALAWSGSISAEHGLIAIGMATGGVQLLQVIQKQGYSRENPVVELSWLWATDYGTHLNIFGVRIERVTGLNPTNIELLKQRGAVGEPAVDRVQEVDKENL